MKNKKQKILFINFGGLGDEILFLPAIISVKKEFPDSEIVLALEPRGKGISQLTGVIDSTICSNIKSKHKYIELLKLLFNIWFNKFDIVVSSGSNKFIAIFLFLTFIPERYGYFSGKLSEILLTKAINLNKNQYAVNMYHDLVSSITKNKTNIPQIDIDKKNTIKNSIVIHPGVSRMSINKGIIKTVPASIWAEVVEKLADKGKKVILAGGPDDKDVIDDIINRIPSEKFENMYGKTKSIKELAELISSAEAFLCSDSAPMHIGIALGVKTFAIFGPTDDKKLVPQQANVFPIRAENCSCPLQPCLWEKRKTSCENKDCLKITADEIVNKVLGFNK